MPPDSPPGRRDRDQRRSSISSPDYAIRRAARRDAAVLQQLLQAVWPADPAPLAPIRRVLAHPDHQTLLAEEGGRPAGFVDSFFLPGPETGPLWQVDLLGVAPAARQRRLGRRLLAASLETGAARGAAAARTLIAVDNLASQALFSSCGFRPDGPPHHLFSAVAGRPPAFRPELVPVPVETLTYRGIWLEAFPGGVPAAGRLPPTPLSFLGVELDGAGRRAAAAGGFRSLGRYQVWTCWLAGSDLAPAGQVC